MFKSRLKAFLSDRRGGVIIYVALTMPVLVGGMGLGAESGYRYYNQRLLQHAADVAAHAGAVRKFKENNSNANVERAALNVATESGFMSDIGVLPVSHVPPTSGAFTGNASAVEVILTETRPRLFSAIFSEEESVVIGARAVAAVTATGSSGCILALSGTASPAVTVQGSPSVSLSGCSVAANSTASNAFSIPNSLNTPMLVECVYTVGGAYTHSSSVLRTDCDSPVQNSPATQDPYYWVTEPAAASIPCQTTYNNGRVGTPNATTNVAPSRTWTHPSGTTLNVMRFCNGLDAKGVVNFAPGLYIVEGGTMTSSGTNAAQLNGPVSPAGVTFYFGAGGALNIGANTTLNLSAPTSGPYAGILFFGSRSNSLAHSIQGTAASVTEGAIYMPASRVTFTGNSAAASGCTQVIANTIVLTGNSTLTADCSNDNVQEILVGHVISVVE